MLQKIKKGRGPMGKRVTASLVSLCAAVSLLAVPALAAQTSYDVRIYDNSGSALLHTFTVTEEASTPSVTVYGYFQSHTYGSSAAYIKFGSAPTSSSDYDYVEKAGSADDGVPFGVKEATVAYVWGCGYFIGTPSESVNSAFVKTSTSYSSATEITFTEDTNITLLRYYNTSGGSGDPGSGTDEPGAGYSLSRTSTALTGSPTLEVTDTSVVFYDAEGTSSEYTVSLGENETFLGLATSPNQTTATYPVGHVLPLDGAVDLYVVTYTEEVASYDVKIYDNSGSTLLHTFTYTGTASLEIGENELNLLYSDGSTSTYTPALSETETLTGLSLTAGGSDSVGGIGDIVSLTGSANYYLIVTDTSSGSGTTDPEVTPTPSVIDQEKNEADSSGNSAVDDMTDAVPDYSEQFIDALTSFAGAFAYEGTEAVLPIPSLTVPGIPGLIPETVIFDGEDLDFGDYIALLPSTLLLLVQSLLTIALIVFCFKELYGTISYVLTLKRGGAEE